VILAVIAVFTIATLFALNDSKANAIALDVNGSSVEWEPEVVVVGQQWWWEYRYYFNGVDLDGVQTAADLPPADIVTSTQMVVPAGEEIELIITARDVIHSHWIPNLNGKRDAVPGRFHPWLIEADDPGVYWGQCTEFCGLSHSRMRMQVVALSPADFQAWVDSQLTPWEAPEGDARAWLEEQRSGEEVDAPTPAPTDSAVARGMVTFRQACSSCHLVNGLNDDIYDGAAQVSGAAPDLTHFASRTTYGGGIFYLYNADGSMDVSTLEAWLRNPPAMKDAYAEGGRGMPNLGLSESQIDDLVALLASTGAPPGDWVIEQTTEVR
jgi:cytochrome c oxidase subunit II